MPTKFNLQLCEEDRVFICKLDIIERIEEILIFPKSQRTQDYRDRQQEFLVETCQTDVYQKSKKQSENATTVNHNHTVKKEIDNGNHRDHHAAKADLLVLGHDGNGYSSAVSDFLVKMYRDGQPSDCSQLILNQDDQMICVQLCLAELNKQETGEFDVTMSTVLDACDKLITDKMSTATNTTESDDSKYDLLKTAYGNFLERCNCVDLVDVFMTLKSGGFKIPNRTIIITQLPSSKLEECALRYLCGDRPIGVLDLDVDDSGITFSACESLDEALSALLTCKPAAPVSVTKDYVRGIFLSYLQLLVNSRSELALARVFNVPDRELDHKAFTSLRKVAMAKKLSMCQTAMSNIMRIRLGGKSYQPDPNCPLNEHVKGLSELVELIHKLQTIMEEETDTGAAIRKLMKAVKTVMLRCKTNAIKSETIVRVSDELEQLALITNDSCSSRKGPTPDKRACDGGSVMGRRTMCVLRAVLDQDAGRRCSDRRVNVLGDAFSTQRTPIRFPSIMSRFRSPEAEGLFEDGEEFNVPLSGRVELCRKNTMESRVPRFGSCMDWVDPAVLAKKREDHIFSDEEIRLLNKTSALRLDEKTTIDDATESSTTLCKLVRVPAESRFDQENADQPQPAPKPLKRKTMTLERAADTSHTSPVQARKRPRNNSGKKARKVKPAREIVKGQKRLTDFFRM